MTDSVTDIEVDLRRTMPQREWGSRNGQLHLRSPRW
jgi:hypothetical protein